MSYVIGGHACAETTERQTIFVYALVHVNFVIIFHLEGVRNCLKWNDEF